MRYNNNVYTVEHYLTANGKDVFAAWLTNLRDHRATARITVRIERLVLGLFGDCKPLRDGVWELRIDEGPGYRIYYARAGRRMILLLCGGEKSTQAKDIQYAVDYWQDWQERTS